MSLQPWLNNGDIQKVVVTDKSLGNLLKLIERDLKDCQVKGVSADRRYATAYGAALNLANLVIRKEGYRVTGRIGHHKTTFDVASEILGAKAKKYIDFFDLCRRKRNKVDYDLADFVSETEVDELIDAVNEFKMFIEAATEAG